MPQNHLGERVQTMIRPGPGLRKRLDAGALRKGYGTRKTSRYLVDLLRVLHPDPEVYGAAAAAGASLVDSLLEAASIVEDNDRQDPVPTMIRPTPALRKRLDNGARSCGYSNLNRYLVTLLSALHPDPEAHGPAAEAGASLVDVLLEVARNMHDRQMLLDFELASMRAKSTVAA
ncbi:hypothetical protein [Planomonospora sp. ID82291]|uniref:hypothetical protein n=1 Tax=Planomonospora sp. ID82291 TaxID=2738136 RepID=UPI0018C3CA79|nr:hypothetical protein [Planomonospora sp. ID82291]MBG0818437.1 hypothetical protein [Planomonospora sp. ID82291]